MAEGSSLRPLPESFTISDLAGTKYSFYRVVATIVKGYDVQLGRTSSLLALPALTACITVLAPKCGAGDIMSMETGLASVFGNYMFINWIVLHS